MMKPTKCRCFCIITNTRHLVWDTPHQPPCSGAAYGRVAMKPYNKPSWLPGIPVKFHLKWCCYFWWPFVPVSCKGCHKSLFARILRSRWELFSSQPESSPESVDVVVDKEDGQL